MRTKETKPVKEYEDIAADPVERIEIKLTKAKETKLAQWIDENRSGIEQDRRRFLDRQRVYLYQWDDFVTFNRKGPWEDSSNLHMPLTAIKVKSYLSRLYNIFTEENTTQLMPRETSDEKYVEMIRLLHKWYIWDYLNNYKGIRGFAREVFYDCCTVGFGIGMKDWQTLVRKSIEIVPNELEREMEDLAPQIEEAAAEDELLQTEEELENKSVSVKPYREVEKILSVFEGTRLQSIPFENAFFPNFIPESNDLDFPQVVIINNQMSLSDVILKGQRGEWDRKKVELVKNLGTQNQEGTDAEEIKEHRERLSGFDDTNSWYRTEQRIIEYAFCTYDIDDDGVSEEIVVTKCRNVVLKVNLLDRISPSGKRPLFKFDCFTKPRQGYSRGVPEFLYPLNEEMDQHHNMRIDYLTLQTCPFGVYRGASSLKNEEIQISPGKFIPVDDVSDMKVLNFPTDATALNAEEDRDWHYADLLTSTSSLTQGVVPDPVGPTRSTSGVVTLLRQMDKEFIITVDQCASQWKKMMMLILDDLDYRIDAQVKMRVLGASQPEPILEQTPNIANKLMINSNFDMTIDVARAVTSEEVQRNDAEMILNMLAAPSMMQQMGIVGPKALFRALSAWLKAFGKDPRMYIDEPEFVTKPLTLFQEIQVCAQGEIPPMSMQDNHEEKSQQLVAFMQTPEFQEALASGLYHANTPEFVMRAAKKHLVMFEMMQPKGLPNPSGANGQNLGQFQAGTAPQQGGQNPNQTTPQPQGGQNETEAVQPGPGGEAQGT
jgi:hypothetical protein